MNINYESYKYFYYVASLKSVSKASEVLMVSQPAVSFQIKSLENSLGLSLFIRTKKGVTLTNEGEILFNYVKRGIEEFNNGENAITNLKNLDYGNIRIGASTTVSKHVLMPYLEKFHDKYPNIEIQIINNLTEELISMLRLGSLDMLILNMPMDDNKDLNIIKVMDVQDIFICGKKYIREFKEGIKLKDLDKYPLLFQKSPSNTRDYLDKYLTSNNVKLKPKTEIVSYNLIMDFVKSGFGIGYATKEFILNELNNKELFEIDVKPSIPKRYIGIATLNNTVPNYSVKKLIELMNIK